MGVGGSRLKWGYIGGDVVGGDGVYIVGGLGCHSRRERNVVEVGGVIVESKVPLAFIWVGMVGKGSGVNVSAGVLVAMYDDGVSLL